ncbi:hypothetical protein EDD22DRAFT_962416 [Suillus occidentalis]|nr:hypothetical protein EDD22DRAFT_962416 [Suillus occidentalis]
MDPSKTRKKIGKTTILQRVCNTRDSPEIRNGAGERIDPALLKASKGRRLHNIENEMVFQSKPGFIFHDSRGFEAGDESNFAQAFIARRSDQTNIKDQVYAIWYCIPMDEASRLFTEGEVKFFSQTITKFDALYDVEFAQLRAKGLPSKEAEELAPKHAEESFAHGPQLKFLRDVRRPPKCHTCLPRMMQVVGHSSNARLEL